MGCNSSTDSVKQDMPNVSSAGVSSAPVADSKQAQQQYSGKPLVVFVLGGPGCGKGTQCANVVKDYGFVHLSAGDLLRREQATDSKDSELIKSLIKEGKIVPVEITVRLLRNEMEACVKNEKRLFLVDGFPRNLNNLDGWDTAIGDWAEVAFVLFFDCSEDVMKTRLNQRSQTSGRADDNAESIQKRFVTFQNETMPVIKKFEAVGKVRHVNAEHPKDEVYTVVRSVFDAEIKKRGFSPAPAPAVAAPALSPMAAPIIPSAAPAAAELKEEKMPAVPVVAVITANSQTGLAVVKALVARYGGKCHIKAAVRSHEKAAPLRGLPGVEVVAGIDAERPETLKPALQGASKLFLVTANYVENRCELAKRVVSAAVAAGVKHIVMISVLGAEYELILFSKQMRDIEKHVEASGATWTFLRAGSFFENFLMNKDSIVGQGAFYSSTGQGKWAPVAVSDIGAAGAVALMEPGHENKAYNLTGPELFDHDAMAVVASRVLGYEVKYVDLSRETYVNNLKNFMPAWQAEGLGEMLQLFKEGKAEVVSSDLKNLTGQHTTFEDFATQHAAVFARLPVVAVVPATANTGTAAVSALHALYGGKVRVRALVRNADKAQALRALNGVEIRGGVDTEHPDTVQTALQGVSKVFIVPPTTANRAELAIQAANAAKAAGVKHIVLLSVLGAEYEAIAFGREFRRIEKHIESLGVPFTFLRAPAFYENLLGQVQAVANTYAFYGATTGDSRYSSIAIQDVGRAAAAVLSGEAHEGRAYNLVGGNHTDNETASFFTQTLGYPVRYVDIGPEALRKQLTGLVPDWQLDGLLELIALQAKGQASMQSDDLAKLVGKPMRLDHWLKSRAKMFSHPDLPEEKKPLVAVITGNSNTGGATVRALHTHFAGRVRLRAAVRSEEKASALREMKGVEVFVGVDAERPESVQAACAGASKVFISPPNYIQNRAEAVIKMVDAAKAAGVQHVVLLSVLGAQYEAIEFGRQFRQMEKHIENVGVKFTHLRAAYFMDNFLGSKDSIKGDSHSIHGSHGSGSFPAVAVDDIGLTAAVVLSTPGHEAKAYDLTGPQSLNGDGYAAILSKVLGYTVNYNDHPGDQFVGVLQGLGFPEWQAKGLVELFHLFKEGKADITSSDIPTLTGRHTSFEQWVRSNDGVFGAPVQTTFAFIKPDVLRNGEADAMLDAIRASGFAIVCQKQISLNSQQAEEFYGEHKGKPFFEGLVGFMTSGPAIALALRKPNAILDWRAALGPTDSSKARVEAPNSLRAHYGTDGRSNAGHGSDSVASAERELKLIFPEGGVSM